MRLGPEDSGEDLEDWLDRRVNDLESYRETDHFIEYENTLERMRETIEQVLEE